MKVFFFTLSLILLSNVLSTANSAAQPQPSPGLSSCAIDLGPDVMVCKNAVFTLNPHPEPAGVYSWSGSIGLSCYDCPSPLVSGLNTGVYTYIATVTTPDCTASDTIVVTVINGEAPLYKIAEDQGICAGDSISLGGQSFPGTFYNWYSIPSGFVSTVANPADKPAGPITYYLSVSNTSCPLPTLDSVRITPVALSLQISPSDTVKICRGKSRTLQAVVNPAAQTIIWTPTTGLQIGPNGSSAVATPTESTSYTATVSLAGCTRQQSVYFAVDSLPADLDIYPADTTICQGEKVVLQSPVFEPVAYPGITFKWTPASGILTPDSLYNIAVQPAQTTPYRRITRNGACADTALAIVRVIPAAQINVSPTSSEICPGESVDLNITYTAGVTDIKWSPATGLSCINCDNPVATPVTSTTYTVSGNYQGCPVSAAATVNIKPLAPLKFPTDVQLCPGESVLLNEIFDPGATYIWTSTHPGFGTDTLPNPTFTPTQTATYYVLADNGCLRMDSIRITVNMATLTVSADTTICKNFSVNLKALTSIQGTLQWRNELTGQIIGNTSVVTVKPDQTTTYTVIYTYGDNCQITKKVTVTIEGVAPVIQFPLDTKLCLGENLPLNSGPVLPGTVYNWTANPPDASLLPGASLPTVSPTQNTTYAVTATLDNCTVSQQLDVTVFSATLTVSSDTTICAKTQVNLKATGSDPGGTYVWSTGESTASISKSPVTATTYTVVYTYGDNCKLADSVQVNVVPNFALDIQCVPDTTQVNIGTLLTLTAVVTPPQSLLNFTFKWEETTVDTQTLPFGTESIDVVPSSNDTSTAVVRYTLTAVSPAGCVQVMEKSIRLIFPIVRFPNAFTPDGDGHNDVFEMIVPQGLAYIDRMEIYNRWGQKIFESTDPAATWDGTANGESVPADVYVYRVWWRRGDGALQMQSKGDLTLLR